MDEGTFFRALRFFWSEDGRFVALDHPWIWYTNAIIIDTMDFSETNLIGLVSIVDAVSNVTNYEFCISPGSDHHHTLIGWLDASILEVDFYWLSTEAGIIRGIYHLDVITWDVKDIVLYLE